MPDRLKSALLAVVLFLANAYICRELFHAEYLRNMGSIEGAYIGISRYAMAHWRDLTWFPLWYNGVPYQNTYPPLLHLIVALVAWLRGMSPALAYHWTTALAYCLGPVTLFALVKRLSGSPWTGFASGLLYTAFSPSAWLIPDIAHDIGGAFHARRLQTLTYYGEGPHVAAMTLLPLAVLLVDLAVRKRNGVYVAGAAIGLAAVVLTNWLAGFAVALAIGAYVLATAGKWRDFVLIAAIGFAAYGLAIPWAPPSTIAVTQFNAQTVGGDYTTVYHALPRWLAVTGCGIAALKLATRKRSKGLQFAIFFSFLTVLITLSDAWFHRAIVPQAGRYHLEMEMALAILAAMAAQQVLSRAPRSVAVGAMVLLIILLAAPVRVIRHYARTSLILTTDITKTSEWKTADWLNRNWPGERVMLAGSSAFWLTAFSDTPELGGGFDQGRTDDVLREGSFRIITGSGEEAVRWLKALGVQAVGVSANSDKLNGHLEPLWSDGENVLYRVETTHRSLARVVRRGYDPTLRGYVATLDDPAMPGAVVSWTSQHSLTMVTNLAAGQVISLQMAWHPGWHARADGTEITIVRDALGMIRIDPHWTGPLNVELYYDGGLEMRIAKWICGITALLLAALAGHGILKKSW